MASIIKFVEGFQQTLSFDYINTQQRDTFLENKLSKSLEKYVEQLPSLSRENHIKNIYEGFVQLDTYDQVSPSYTTTMQF